MKTADWGSGWEGKYTITNGGTAPVTSWRVEFDLPAGTTLGSYWDALLTSSGNHHSFTNREYNGTLAPGASRQLRVPRQWVRGAAELPGQRGRLRCGRHSPVCRPRRPTCGSPRPPASAITLGWNAVDRRDRLPGLRGHPLRATVSGTSATFSGLPACTSRTYTVAAYNAVGESARSAPVTGTTTGCQQADLPRHFLTGYWHNFVNPATELRLSAVPNEYDLIAVAFAEATSTPGAVTFGVDPGLSAALGGYTNDQFKADVATLKSRGKKVILSVGGEAGRVTRRRLRVRHQLRQQRPFGHGRVRLRRRRHRPGERAQPDLHGPGAAEPAQPGRRRA